MTTFLATLVVLLTCGQMGLPHAAMVATPDDRGPDIINLDRVPGCYGSVRFDHRLHVNMSSIGSGCTTCHHDAAKDAVILPCRDCHEPTSAAVTTDRPGLRGAYHRQCLSCHKEWAHENACGFCHTASSSLTARAGREREPHRTLTLQPRSEAQATYVYQTAHKSMPVVTFHHADHSEVFGLNCADCHGGSSCGQCHGAGAERPVVSRQQTCYKCHSESRCVTCHHLAERPRFNHESCTGWRLRPGHADLKCTNCHETGHMPARPTSNACLACHAAEAGGVFDHDQFGVELYGDHALFECVDCHAGGDDRTIARCTACHANRPILGKREVGRSTLPGLTTEAAIASPKRAEQTRDVPENQRISALGVPTP